METLEPRIKEQAHALGFELVGIAPATQADGFERMREWLDQGHAGEMGYMYRQAEARRHPDSILPDVRSVIMVGMNYADRGSRMEDRGWKIEDREKAESTAIDPRSSILDPQSSISDPGLGANMGSEFNTLEVRE